MRSRSTKTDKKIALFLEQLQTKEKISIDEIIDLLQCNRASVYNYIKRLEKEGYTTKKELIKNKVYYYLSDQEQSNSNFHSFEPMTANILRKYVLVRELQKGSVEKSTFRKHFTVYKNKEDGNGRIPLDVKLTKYYHLLKELINEGEIVLDPSNEKYYLTGKNIPLQLSLSESELCNMYYELENITSGTPYYEQLKSLYTRIGVFYGNIDAETPYSKNYIVYGKQMQGFSHINSFLQKITACDYKNKILEISYNTKHGKQLTILLAVGLIIYSIEKDTCYILGKEYTTEKEGHMPLYTIIDVSDIIQVNNTSEVNPCYKDSYFMSVFETMFSISTEAPVKVTVEFDRTYNIERKILYLSKQRKKSDVKILNDKILYMDTISGLSDFANYLRQFGRSVNVIEPLSLKEKMMASVERALSRYEEEN